MANLKALARRIFFQTLAAIDIGATMERKLRRADSLLDCGTTTVDLRAFDRLVVVSIGKAAHAMAGGLAAVLGPEVEFRGVVAAPTAPTAPLHRVRYFVAGHPLPNAQSWSAGEEILSLLKTCNARTLVFFLLSGGGSALTELPLDLTLTLEDVQALYRALVTCGAPIADLGIVRRHLSAVKGGRLAVAAGESTKITLAVSDVPAGQEAALASGPTIPDPTTVADVERVVREYGLIERLPGRVRTCLEAGRIAETPKHGHPAFVNAHFSLLLGMDDLFHPAHRAAEAAGCLTRCDNSTDDWPVTRSAEYLLAQLENLRKVHRGYRVGLIADGEVSSPVTGDGLGGRNSAFVLSCVEKIAGRGIVVLSAGTDGIDGNSPAAGAVADAETLRRAREMGMEPAEAFQRCDAYTFFERLGDAVVTGPTGVNLRDLRVLIAEPEKTSGED